MGEVLAHRRQRTQNFLKPKNVCCWLMIVLACALTLQVGLHSSHQWEGRALLKRYIGTHVAACEAAGQWAAISRRRLGDRQVVPAPPPARPHRLQSWRRHQNRKISQMRTQTMDISLNILRKSSVARPLTSMPNASARSCRGIVHGLFIFVKTQVSRVNYGGYRMLSRATTRETYPSLPAP
jgi:hypothetical protein